MSIEDARTGHRIVTRRKGETTIPPAETQSGAEETIFSQRTREVIHFLTANGFPLENSEKQQKSLSSKGVSQVFSHVPVEMGVGACHRESLHSLSFQFP